jgi:hypothetical protein
MISGRTSATKFSSIPLKSSAAAAAPAAAVGLDLSPWISKRL